MVVAVRQVRRCRRPVESLIDAAVRVADVHDSFIDEGHFFHSQRFLQEERRRKRKNLGPNLRGRVSDVKVAVGLEIARRCNGQGDAIASRLGIGAFAGKFV